MKNLPQIYCWIRLKLNGNKEFELGPYHIYTHFRPQYKPLVKAWIELSILLNKISIHNMDDIRRMMVILIGTTLNQFKSIESDRAKGFFLRPGIVGTRFS